MNGSNDEDNLVYLYAQEHYYAHKLLAIENPKNNGCNTLGGICANVVKMGKEIMAFLLMNIMKLENVL